MREGGELGGSGVFDAVCVTCVCRSTLDGMIAVTKLLGKVQAEAGHALDARKIVGIDASSKDIIAQRKLALGTKKDGEDNEVRLNHVAIGRCWSAGKYVHSNRATAGALRELVTIEGVITDPVYMGKGIRAQ